MHYYLMLSNDSGMVLDYYNNERSYVKHYSVTIALCKGPHICI